MAGRKVAVMARHTALRQLRRSRTISQKELARMLRVAQPTICKYERGLLVPPIGLQVRIAAILGVSVADAFGDVREVA
jgi:transcriptional regulator with XRE-family HTH domain